MAGCNPDLAGCHGIMGKRTFHKGDQLCQMLARGKSYPIMDMKAKFRKLRSRLLTVTGY